MPNTADPTRSHTTQSHASAYAWLHLSNHIRRVAQLVQDGTLTQIPTRKPQMIGCNEHMEMEGGWGLGSEGQCARAGERGVEAVTTFDLLVHKVNCT